MPRKPNVELMGFREIAELFGVKYNTAQHLPDRYEDFPEPDWNVSGRPVWWGPTIRAWGKKNGRLA